MGLYLIPGNLNIDFVGFRKISYIVSIAVILVGMASLVIKGGPSYGIDFAGGMTVQIKFEKPISDESLKKALEGANLPGLAVQRFGTDELSYLLRLSAMDESATGAGNAVKEIIANSLPDHSFEIQRLEMVGPKVGADLRSKAVEALYFAILMISIYISGRFEHRWVTSAAMAIGLGGSMFGLSALGFDKFLLVFLVIIATLLLCWRLRLIFALGAVVSILHDILITVGIFSLLNKEFDLTIIAAILTVVGYSLNDTIIIYDSIRENLRKQTGDSISIILNKSINQTISRTVLTSGTTLMVVLALLIWGGGIIHDFALVLFIGIFVGTYSSMFVATPILLLFGDDIAKSVQVDRDTRPRDADGRIAAQV